MSLRYDFRIADAFTTSLARATDEGDVEDVYNTERHLLYVASTRARDELWVSGVRPASEFLADLAGRQ